MPTHLYMCTVACTYPYTHTRAMYTTCIHTHACNTYTHIHAYTYMSTHTLAHIHMHTHKHTYMHAYIHTHTHIHTLARAHIFTLKVQNKITLQMRKRLE